MSYIYDVIHVYVYVYIHISLSLYLYICIYTYVLLSDIHLFIPGAPAESCLLRVALQVLLVEETKAVSTT